MSEKWTPGPWEVDKENCHAGQIAVCHGDKDTYFEVWSRHWFGGIDQEANAHLIAAAPEMYEALNAANALLGEIEDFGDVTIWGLAKQWMEIRDAALKKARGEA